MKLSNKTYDILKWVAQILLPSLGALYFGLSQVWNLPYGEEVVGTITLVDTFLGALLGISNNNYTLEYDDMALDSDDVDEVTDSEMECDVDEYDL